MSRYANTDFQKQKIKDDGNSRDKLAFNTTYYNRVPHTDSDLFLIATEGDRCDILAQQLYGNVNFWWYIARVNNLHSMNIPAGTKLRIPSSVSHATGG